MCSPGTAWSCSPIKSPRPTLRCPWTCWRRPSPVLSALESWTQESIHNTLIHLAESLGVKNATLMWPLRISIAGKTVTPGGAVELCYILGKEETLRRMELGIQKLKG